MLIGIDASRANRAQKTGVEWYAWHVIQNLKTYLNTAPDDIRVILYSENVLQGELADLPNNWEAKVLHWPPKKMWTQIRLSFEMIINPPDILFVPAHVFPLIHPKKTVMTVHDVAALKFPRSYSRFQAWYTIWSAKKAVKKLWKIITPSVFTKNEILEACAVGDKKTIDKIKVISHGYDKKYQKIYHSEKTKEVLKKYNINNNFLLAVGRLEEKKNTKRIIQAFNHLLNNLKSKDYQLVLVGDPGFGFEEVKKTIADSLYKDKIIRTGWLPADDIVYILNAAKVLVFTSLYEGFGLPALEAMACGVPVVASKNSSVKEVAEDACVYVDAKDVWGITKGITELLENDQLKNENIKNGLERVKNFSWEKCAAEVGGLLLG